MAQVEGTTFQTGEWITLYMLVFMTCLVISIVSYYNFICPTESPWMEAKRKKKV